MNRVLIITYYWPPGGGSGVQRWLKFVKYLAKEGWDPFVFTPENPASLTQDPSLLKDVPDTVEIIRLPIWEPYSLFFKMSKWFGNKTVSHSDFISTGKKSFFQGFSAWVRGNFFIPDARIFWVKPAATFLEDFLRSNRIDTIITTGPPHSMHLIGLKLKEKNPALRWIADFRDPWSEWDLLDTLSLSAYAKRKHKRLEKKVLTTADQVITIAPYHVKRLEHLSGRSVALITNGFDAEDFLNIQRIRNSRFTIRHVGAVDELRDPRPVMEVIAEICRNDPSWALQITIEFIGSVNSAFKQFVAADGQLSKVVSFIDQMPHDVLLSLYGGTDLQLLVLANTVIAPGNLPGKFFEYLASGNPILALGPTDGDAADVLRETHAGTIYGRDDKSGMRSGLLSYYQQWKAGRPPAERDVSGYSRHRMTMKLIALLKNQV